jgi:hypothetical protein
VKGLTPKIPDYDAIAWRELAFKERVQLACQSWALDGYGAPVGVLLFYALKMALYVGGWLYFCGFSPSLGSASDVATWGLAPLAFKKAIVWSLLFEVLGLGCGSGPLTGRNIPPFGGVLYFLRPGGVKLSFFQKLPLLGGTRRGVFDVLVYAGLCGACLLALTAPGVESEHIGGVLGLLLLAGLCDKTLFLAARGEHYGVMCAVFLCASTEAEWIAGGQFLACCLWFFAGVSKLNRHFPSVVAAMISNSATFRLKAFRRAMYQSYPEDLRPSALARWMAHMGTALELSVPLVLCLAGDATMLSVGLGLMVLLHLFISCHVPAGVPLEWNVLVVYGGFVLFGGFPDVAIWDAGLPCLLLLLGTSVVVPLLGNFFPAWVSFLPSMRYYAGNWAFSLWFFRGDSVRKLHKEMALASPWVGDQLGYLYDEPTVQGVMSRPVGFRLMHLHGRIVGGLMSDVLSEPLRNYEWVDGEVVAGMVLGWNFGDGHLHDEQLLGAIQEACGYESGELRCLFVESQPLCGDSLSYRIVDAVDGRLSAGSVPMSALHNRQTWSDTPFAD